MGTCIQFGIFLYRYWKNVTPGYVEEVAIQNTKLATPSAYQIFSCYSGFKAVNGGGRAELHIHVVDMWKGEGGSKRPIDGGAIFGKK